MLRQPLHQIGDLIAGRYRTQSVLGQGSSGITFAVEDVHTHQQYALKALSLKGIRGWKQLELFDREAQVLSQLDHPAIPRYIDYFQMDTEEDRWFYLVQELAPGKSLAALVNQGWRVNQSEVQQIGLQVLEILTYLHELTPAIIHRDIKPQNLVRSDKGQIYLVDFGAVQTVYHHTMMGSTIVGTYGYMAPEHFRGKAVPATDLYSLGATLIFLLTHCSPADVPQKRLKIDFRSVVQLDPDFADWLDHMLEPAVEDRFVTAQNAIAVLRQPSAIQQLTLNGPESLTIHHQPDDSKVKLQKTKTGLFVHIPPIGWRSDTVLTGCFTVFVNAMIFVVLLNVFRAGLSPLMFGFTVFFVGGIGIGLLIAALFYIVGHTYLEINPEYFRLFRQVNLPGCRYGQSGQTVDLSGIKLTTTYASSGLPVKICTLMTKDSHYHFGAWLSPREQAWLVEEVGDFLRSQQR